MQSSELILNKIYFDKFRDEFLEINNTPADNIFDLIDSNIFERLFCKVIQKDSENLCKLTCTDESFSRYFYLCESNESGYFSANYLNNNIILKFEFLTCGKEAEFRFKTAINAALFIINEFRNYINLFNIITTYYPIGYKDNINELLKTESSNLNFRCSLDVNKTKFIFINNRNSKYFVA